MISLPADSGDYRSYVAGACALHLGVGDQIDAGFLEKLSGLGSGQQLEFDLAGFLKARVRRAEVVVAIAGMANEFPRAFWDILEDAREQGRSERPCSGDAKGAVGRAEARTFYKLRESGLEKT